MKKIISVILALALIFSLGSVSVFAATISADGGSTPKDVKAIYNAASAPATVYSVDVAWGSLEYTYNAGSVGEWDAENHQYINAGTATWTCEENADKITVTNHSNTAITVNLAYAKDSTINTVNGAFSKNTFNLATAVGTTKANAPQDTATLTLSGTLADTTTTLTKVGTVTVTID